MYRRRSLIFVLLVALLLAQRAYGQSSTPVARGSGGAVASVDWRATQAGIAVLRSGGNAVDAAIAVMAALGVVEAYSCGIGGGGFMLVYWRKTGEVVAFDGREQASADTDAALFADPETGEPLPLFPERITNGRAVGVPGTVAMWELAHRRFGSRAWAELFAPAIALAEDGFTVDALFAEQTAQNQARFAIFSATAALYLSERNSATQAGTLLRNPDLARTYRLLAERGAEVFYRGEIAQAIVRTVQSPRTVPSPPFDVLRGTLTLDDLAAYRAFERAPVQTTYRGNQVYGIGLPSSGGITVAVALNILEGYPLSALDRVQAWHYVIEAMRLAYADRAAFLADPEATDAPIEGLLSKAYAAERRALIGTKPPSDGANFRATHGEPQRFQPTARPQRTATFAQLEEGASTTHLTVADADGNIVSATFTLGPTGGSGMVVDGYGFLLNATLINFDLDPASPNAAAPAKRPRSSIAPTLILTPEGTAISFGSQGSTAIISNALSVTLHLLDFGSSLEEAIAAPRLSQRNTGATQAEAAFIQSKLGKALSDFGHVFSATEEIGAMTGVLVRADGGQVAAAEPTRRRGGAAAVVKPAN
ncbi:MAG: gamma-glutamyltransferase [Anaerolineae bacterium]|nr:gamma-glutamyltransferase [Anaerolineae bacterium]